MKLLFNLLFIILSFGLNAQEGYNIDIQVDNYENDTLIVGYYYGNRQLVRDTLYTSGKKGAFVLKGDEKMDGGMYLLLFKPENTILQFLMPEDDQTFSLVCDIKELGTGKVQGNIDNESFFGYLDYLSKMRAKADPIKAEIALLKEEKKNVGDLQKQVDALDKEVNAYRDGIIAKNPSSVTSQLLKSNIEVELPEFEGDEEEKALSKFHFYKDHYFDNIDFSYPSLVRTPYFHTRFDTYLEKLTVNNPDSLIKSIDHLLSLVKENEDAYKYSLSTFLNKYAKNKFIGMDAIYVHMVDQYYAKGEADWVDEENLLKMQENANNLRPILIGKTFPNVTVFTEDEKPLMIHNVEAEYTMVMFWAPDCGHCKKSMPKIIKFYEEYKDKGLKVVSVCTKGGKKFDTCWKYINEKGMDGFINAGDKFQKYRKYVYVPSTPKIFILDSKKEILMKDVPAEELSNIMDKIIEQNSSE